MNLLTFFTLNSLIINLVYSLFVFNPVYSILFLILAFINVSTLFLLGGVQFIAFLILLVYVGAISILFLFVMMLLNIEVTLQRRAFSFKVPVFVCCALIFIQILISTIFYKYLFFYPVFIYIDWIKQFYIQRELVALGVFMYNYNQSSIIFIGILLLIALVGSLVLVTEKRNIRKQTLALQLADVQNKLSYYK